MEGLDDGGGEASEERKDREEGLEPPEGLLEGEGGAGRRDEDERRNSRSVEGKRRMRGERAR